MRNFITTLIGLSLNVLMVASMILMHQGYEVFDNILNIMNAYLVLGNLFVIVCTVGYMSIVKERKSDKYEEVMKLATSLTKQSMVIRQVVFYSVAFSVASWYGLWGTLVVMIFSAIVTFGVMLVMISILEAMEKINDTNYI